MADKTTGGANRTSSASQNAVFFPDMLAPGQCRLLKFGTGNTLFIPSGWIHAVFTPKDTLVFGGNFLHSMGAAMQLRVHDIEMATKVPQKYLFPRYKLLYRLFISQMLDRLREELFGWKDLAGIEGYHAIFGTDYSHDKETLLTRLRGAELSAREGPRIGEDMEKFIFLRKCLWRQQMRVRRVQRKEAAKEKAKRVARVAVESGAKGENGGGSGGSDGSKGEEGDAAIECSSSGSGVQGEGNSVADIEVDVEAAEHRHQTQMGCSADRKAYPHGQG